MKKEFSYFRNVKNVDTSYNFNLAKCGTATNKPAKVRHEKK